MQVGVLTYDVLVGRPPFASEDPTATVTRILLEDPEFPDEVRGDISEIVSRL
jgi:hypothetical protein